MITDAEQADHARSHVKAAMNHIAAAGEHLDAWQDEAVEKMAGAHLSKAAIAIGRASEQHVQGKKHIDSLIGREGWDGESGFEAAKAGNGPMGADLKMAEEHHQVLNEAVLDGDAKKAIRAHTALRAHLGKASGHAASVVDGITKSIEGRGKTDKFAASGKLRAQVFFEKSKDGEQFRLFMPFTKAEELSDGTLVIEACASVSGFIDSDEEYFTAEGLRKLAESWAPFGNLRGQHDPNWPAGTVRNPVLGKSETQYGWWIDKHPETMTDALFVRAHVVEEKAIGFVKSGVFTGLSVGGKIPPGGRKVVEVEVDERGVVMGEAA